MATAAEKRATLEARLKKLTEKDPAAKIAETKAKLEEDIKRLETHKDLEGRLALWDVNGDGSCKVRVLIHGYKRKAFGRDLFEVSPAEGEGATSVSIDKLEVEKEEAPTPA